MSMTISRLRSLVIQEDSMQLKRISAKIAKEVGKFWLKINKVIAFKQKGEADEARQKVNTTRFYDIFLFITFCTLALEAIPISPL